MRTVQHLSPIHDTMCDLVQHLGSGKSWTIGTCDAVQTDGLSGGASLKEAGAAPVASDEFAMAGDPSPPSPLQAGTCTPSPQVVTAAPQEPELTSLPPPFSLMQPRAAQPPPPLVMPTAFRGLQDPFWALLLAHIVQVRACMSTICSDGALHQQPTVAAQHECC